MINKIKILTFFSLLVAMQGAAQALRRPIAAAYTCLGAYSINHVDVFSFSANQASLAQLKNTSVGVYGERRFMLNDLNHFSAAVGLPTHSGNFGLKGNYFGSGDYNETTVGLAYGMKLGQKLDIGAQFNYHGISISSGYGNASAISFELGSVLHISERLHAGLHVSNPVGGKFGKNDEEKLSSVYAFGVGYEASSQFFVSAEIEKEEDRDINVNAGLQYKLIPQLLVRAGMLTATSQAWFGVGLKLKSFRLDMTASYHPQLGITPGLLLLFEFNKSAK